jgi:leucyl-tRNA synthetase
MVCHETYKDKNDNWVSPDELIEINGKKFLKKNNKEKIIVGPPESMSKSKKNTVDPEMIIKNYGADAVRLFILSDSPPEKDVQWSDEGIIASFKFLQKLWNLHLKILNKIKINSKKNTDNNLDKITNIFIKDVSECLKNFSYNKIIANLHKVYNQVFFEIDKEYSGKTLIDNYKKIIITMMPVIPHFANECLDSLEESKDIKWPSVDEKIFLNEKINYVVQINGKKRGILLDNRNLSEDELVSKLYANLEIKKYIQDKKIKKQIFIPNRLINLII